MKTIAALAAVLAMAQPALAATYLCAEEQSTGFNWEGGRWVQTNYIAEQHIIQKRPYGESIASGCFSSISEDGHSTDRIVDSVNDVLATEWACYSDSAIGEEPTYMDVSQCEELYFKGELYTVSCGNVVFGDYKFEPTGEFIITRTSAAPLTVKDPSQTRDSLAMSIGKCSVIAP